MRRREEELQRRREEKRRREDEERSKMEADRRAERQKERQAEQDKRKDEERHKREDKQDDDKEPDEETKTEAMLSVLKVIQKMSSKAAPETFESLKKELDEVLHTELPKTGDQQPVLKAEADRVVEFAKRYVAEVSENQ